MATMTMTQTAARPARKSADAEGTDPLTIRLEPAICMTEKQFAEFCAQNSELRIERAAKGDLEIMPPAFSDTGSMELDVAGQVWAWTRANRNGMAFGPTAGFRLPNGAVRSPDASWIPQTRLDALTEEERAGFWQVCPDFVVELRSETDRLSRLQSKMQEYIDNGARLGWLVDPIGRRAYVYRPGSAVEVLDAPQTLSGDPELAGFTLDMSAIWEPAF